MKQNPSSFIAVGLSAVLAVTSATPPHACDASSWGCAPHEPHIENALTSSSATTSPMIFSFEMAPAPASRHA
ncbi:MAG: hypothetical protein HYU78_07290 [Rhodocyclales bacterium]|nr:hypothetical protein [Rhodocyclales bacterium]